MSRPRELEPFASTLAGCLTLFAGATLAVTSCMELFWDTNPMTFVKLGIAVVAIPASVVLFLWTWLWYQREQSRRDASAGPVGDRIEGRAPERTIQPVPNALLSVGGAIAVAAVLAALVPVVLRLREVGAPSAGFVAVAIAAVFGVVWWLMRSEKERGGFGDADSDDGQSPLDPD